MQWIGICVWYVQQNEAGSVVSGSSTLLSIQFRHVFIAALEAMAAAPGRHPASSLAAADVEPVSFSFQGLSDRNLRLLVERHRVAVHFYIFHNNTGAASSVSEQAASTALYMAARLQHIP